MVADSLVDLAEKSNGKLPPGQRVYRVRSRHTDAWDRYAISNSPGQAAQAVCCVERVPDKEFVEAAFVAINRIRERNGSK